MSRFIIEIFRGDERGTVGIFSTSQFISLVLAPLAIGMLVYLARAKSAGAQGLAQAGGLSGSESRKAVNAQLHTFTVSDDADGVRLDLFVVSVLPAQLALADSTPDQGRPGAGRRAARPRPISR